MDYEAIKFVTNWVGYLLIIVPVGAGTMITYQSVRKATTDDQSTIDDAKKKIRTTIIGAIIAVSISGLITIIEKFYT